MKKQRRRARTSSARARTRRGGRKVDHHTRMDPALQRRPHYVPGCSGAFITVNSNCRDEVTTLPNNHMYVLIMWTRSNWGRYIKWSQADNQIFWKNLTQFGSSDSPANIRPLKQSVRIKNLTAAQNVAGQVRYLRAEELPAGLTISAGANPGTLFFSNASIVAFQNWMDNDAKVRGITAAELRRTHKWILPPVNMVNYAQYQRYLTTQDASTLDAFIFDQIGKEPMAAMLFHFPPTATANTYEVTYHAQDACQYPPASALHHQASELTGSDIAAALLAASAAALNATAPVMDASMSG